MAESSKNSKDINLEYLEPNPSARVEGIVTAILPMKVGKVIMTVNYLTTMQV